MHERETLTIRTTIAWVVLGATVLVITASTVANGSRSLVASTAVATSVHTLFLLYVLMVLRQSKLKAVLRAYPALWIALAVWLLVASIQSFGWLGYDNHDRSVTLFELNLYFAYAGFLFLTCCVLDSFAKIRFVIFILLILAVAQTAFGLYNHALGQSPFGWKPSLHSGIRVSGTYLNRNFYGNLVIMSVGFALVPLLFKRAEDNSPTIPGRRTGLFKTCCLVATTAFLLLGLLQSGSRGAVIAFGGALVGIVAVSLAAPRCRPRLLSVAGLGVVFIAAGMLGFSRSRFTALAGDSAGRLEQWKATIALIGDNWFSGFGPGSYETVYKTGIPHSASPLVFNHAHNDYLELMLEQGLSGALPVLAVIVLVMLHICIKLGATQSYNKTVIMLSSLFGAWAMLLHAFVDYPFQVPSNVLIFLTVVALGLACARLPYRNRVP